MAREEEKDEDPSLEDTEHRLKCGSRGGQCHECGAAGCFACGHHLSELDPEFCKDHELEPRVWLCNVCDMAYFDMGWLKHKPEEFDDDDSYLDDGYL